ncbi:MAG: DNA-binding response regulator [Anaerolineae bacterium]|nr:DNA-binding response regulator [Anaerolineae bacterium]
MTKDKIRVILVDDHPSVRAGIRQFIERDPMIEVLAEGNDGLEALELIRQHRPHVVLIDLQMPNLSGLDVIRQNRQAGIDVAFLALTGHDEDSYVFAALRAGAKGYLLKTAGPTELARGIRLVYAGQSALDPMIMDRVIDQLPSATAPLPAETEQLSEREIDVLRLAAQGLTNRAIGVKLGIKERTVHSHLMNIYSKLHVNSRTEAAMKAVRMGWITNDPKDELSEF